MKQKIFLIIGILLLSIFWVSMYNEFMANHTYYRDMIANWGNRKLLLRWMISVSISIVYIIKSKIFSVKKFFLYILPATLMVFATSFALVKESIIWGSAGFIILMINTLFLYFLSVYVIVWLTALGTWISQKWIKFQQTRWQEMLINFGIGLGVLLLLMYVITMLHLIRWILIAIIFVGLGFMVWYMKSSLEVYTHIIGEVVQEFRGPKLQANRWKWIGIVLLAISILYYIYGFQLAFIPYSTAWDANHAYMYTPKILAENHGVLRGNGWVADSVPGLWHMFITFFFALIQPIKSWFWLSPDTIAVAMNFLSGLFVLVFGTALIKEAMMYFMPTKNEDDSIMSLGLYSGWMMLLFWLTSGMGAFLVFVDNKTDLWVMALTILAILSGFVFLKYVLDTRERGTKLHRDALKYIIISWIMFAWALMSKPTAFIDIALFGLLLIGLWINSIIALGTGIMAVGMMGILKIANAPDMMSPGVGKYVVLIGAVIVIIGIIHMVLKSKKTPTIRSDKKRLLTYIGIRGLTLLATVVVFKGPNILLQQLNNHTFSPGTWIKNVLLVQKTPTTLLATTADIAQMQKQTEIDQTAMTTTSLSLQQCKQTTFDEEDLQKDLRPAVASNEDVGRYVGYGRKDITKGQGLSLWYRLLRLIYPQNNTCYGINRDAKLLCKNAKAIANFNIITLQSLQKQVKQWGQAYEILSGVLAVYQQQSSGTIVNPAEYRDEIMALQQYYQVHAIFTEQWTIHIPYRYLVPFNVVFNRSLQNLSSYYTDIGFVWLSILCLLVVGLIYTLCHINRYPHAQNLMVLSGVAIVGWAIWRIIGWGIVWYGMGLIVWTIIAVTLLFKDMITHAQDDKEKTMFYVMMFLLVIWWLIQFILNFIRISSQGSWWPFLRYKMSNGTNIEITENLEQKSVVQVGYGRKDVFDLQFPHYNKLIEHIKTRDDKDGVLIAGTYIQYFLDNQRNLKMDGMLNRFREQNSDGNVCKSYQRLRNNNLKYLVIDPNIGTVVMGEGNETLFNRFFAKRDSVSGKIEDDGAISDLVKLWKSGYITLFSTNNLWAKYAFSIDDATLKAKFGEMSDDDMVFLRAKLSVARFFDDAQTLINGIGDIFTSRIQSGKIIGDIADVYGKNIDETKIFTTAQALLNQQTPDVASLSQDERLILMQYLGIVNLYNTNAQQYQEFLNNIMWQSLGGWSQLIVFELK